VRLSFSRPRSHRGLEKATPSVEVRKSVARARN
jgi:hypothetical protein